MASERVPPIVSLQNSRIKYALKLRSSRARRKTGEFLIDGSLEIRRAMAAQVQIKSIFVSDDSYQNQPEPFSSCDCLQPVSDKVLAKLSYGEQAAAPVAIATTPTRSLAQLSLSSTSLVLVLDQIEKPGNLGACLRTAAACDVDAVVISNPICELFNPNTIRASRGAIFSLPIAECHSGEFQKLASSLRLPILTARVDGSSSLWDCDFRTGAAVVFGNEAHGLGDDWCEESKNLKAFRIPMHAGVDSLNISISAAVTLYEAKRQRRRGSTK
ncbi:MAG: TrmH family RNA methyltransferase [Pirellulaceae bacterium]